MYLYPPSSPFTTPTLSLSLSVNIEAEAESMKLNFHSHALVLLLLFIIYTSATSGRLMAPKQGEEKLKEISTQVFIVETEGSEMTNELMGMEDCGNGDEECLKRRILSEAHLDYIYTQHHKPWNWPHGCF